MLLITMIIIWCIEMIFWSLAKYVKYLDIQLHSNFGIRTAVKFLMEFD